MQVSFQAAVAHKQDQPGNDFRPGNTGSVSFGLRYEYDEPWIEENNKTGTVNLATGQVLYAERVIQTTTCTIRFNPAPR